MLRMIWIIPLLVITNQSYAKSKCELEWNELKAVQAQLRIKSVEYLRTKEREKHIKYQICRKSKNNTAKNNTLKTTYSKKITTQKSYTTKKYVAKSFGNSQVVVKGKFIGDKQVAWLKYYKTPAECKKPKSTSVFARCLSYRDSQAEKFNILWLKDNAK